MRSFFNLSGVATSVPGMLLATLLLAPLGAEPVPAGNIGLPVLGKVRTRAANEIVASSWSIGGETIDRDFTVYRHYRQYLGPLGAKAIRLQAGWAKCEREPGVYAWGWLDDIVNDAVGQGVRPWLQLSYGNTIYPGGGGVGLAGGFPTSPEALAAWDRWTKALVDRYKDRVHEWEIWNEPDTNKTGHATVGGYVDLYLRTAGMIRDLQPQSRIFALGLAGKLDYADQFLAGLKAKGRLDLVDAITIHGYPRNPDDTSNIDDLRALIAKYGRPIEVRQGETGAPARFQKHAALRDISWTDNLQAKWNLRRLLAHHAKDVPCNLFTMSDMHYRSQRDGGDEVRINYKGLLGTNPDQTIAQVRPAYYAAQNVFGLFDDTLQRIPVYPFTNTSLRGLALSGYQRAADGAQVVALWFNDAPPAEANGVTHVDVTLAKGSFSEPVLVDLLTGRVYALPAATWKHGPEGVTFIGLPVYDSPVLIMEKAVLRIDPDSRWQS